jgi:DNA-binding NarL/FixJ family response regulator
MDKAGRSEGDRSAAREPIRVMVVDDHPVWRDGIRHDLERVHAATVVADASDGGEAIDLVPDAMPDVVLMDLRLPTVPGIEAIRRIVADTPHVKILVLSATGDEADVIEAVKAGASGYLLKSATRDEIADAILRVHQGEPVFTPSLAALVLTEFRRVSAKEDGRDPALTARENEVLRLVAKGYTYREIGQKLFIQHKTVQNHVNNILTKLHLRNRYELMRLAIQRGLDRGPD